MTRPWWETYKPEPEFDIALRRPSWLKSGKRFETEADARRESRRSEGALRRAGATEAAEYLSDCREGYYSCRKTFCPMCARHYRRALIGEALRLHADFGCAAIAVVLLDEAPRGRIDLLDPNKHEQWLRKRLSRAGFDRHPVIVAFEMIYKARKKKWILHVNVCALGCDDPDALEIALSPGFPKGIDCADVTDPAKQLSYVPKFSTYHRPLEQNSKKKSPALPLNDLEHCELVSWMGGRDFSDFLLLVNARRRGSKIVRSA